MGPKIDEVTGPEIRRVVYIMHFFLYIASKKSTLGQPTEQISGPVTSSVLGPMMPKKNPRLP